MYNVWSVHVMECHDIQVEYNFFWSFLSLSAFVQVPVIKLRLVRQVSTCGVISLTVCVCVCGVFQLPNTY